MTGRIFRRHFLTLLPQTLVSLCFIAVIGSTGSLLHAQEEKGRPVPSTSPQPQATPPSTAPGGRTVPQPTARANLVSLNFNRAELVEVIHVLAQHLKLTYTIDPKVKGSVTIYSAEPLKKEDLLPVFHQVLRMNNAVAIKTGDLYRIVPIKEGKGLARPVTGGKDDSYAIQVVPVRFFPVGEMKKLLTPFITPGGEILDYPRGNFLIIMDLPSNIRRLMEIRDLIDVNVFSGMRMEIYQPQIASAEDLAAEMSKIMQAYASSTAQAEGFAAQFLPIPRINQLLVISHSEAAWTYVKRWLERIDVVAEGPGRRIFIYPVENGKATELADILNEVLGQAPGARREPSSTLRDLHRAVPSIVPSLGGMQRGRGESQRGAPGAFAVTPAPAQPPRRRAQQPTRRPSTRPSPGPQVKAPEPTRIVSDPATNSLIIFGTAQEFQNIKNILKDLDVIPRQVLLDVLVAEVTLTDDTKFGIEYEILRKGDTFTGAFAPSPVMISGGINALIGTGGAVRALIETLMSNSRVKVLASPHILATDNRPARIQVGSEEPVPTGVIEAATGAPTVSSSTTIQFRNTGKILTIIPQVNSKGLVHLQIKVEVSERGANVQVGNQSFPSFSTRDVETTAIVQDGETLVIGGIIDETKSRSRSGIPFLMDIPVLGWFFGMTSDSVKRTELIILITPHVIRSVDEARAVTEEFKERLSKVKREIERMKRKGKIQKSIAPKPTS
ncbi:MAG: type II secretion system secretin GspD, partial [Deltaproteobacteria bacterium]|nr:type II secretion system secretin GspD [Deltaproteobacteria bacterium]